MKLSYIIPLKLSKLFHKLGKLVALHPKWTITLSVLSSLLLGLGIIKLDLMTKFDFIFSVSYSRSFEEISIIDQLFPMNTSYNFDEFRFTKHGRFAYVIFTSKDDKTMLRKSVLTEILSFNEIVTSFKVNWKGNTYAYNDICAIKDGNCYSNSVLNYVDQMVKTEANEIDIKYPIDIDLYKMVMNWTFFYFGGVKIDGTRDIIEAKAIRLFYFLDNSNDEKDEISQKWEEELRNQIAKQTLNISKISSFTSSDFDILSWRFIFLGISYFTVGTTAMTIFCILSTMSLDWVTSKPTLAIAGCISALLATLSSTGLLCAFGFSITFLNSILVFLVIGIAVDDMFVLIAAWKITDPKDSVLNRVADTYSRAAMPITMTSLTNFIAFAIGTTIPVPGIKIFCIHSTLAMGFDIIYQLTFFGGCMALDGYREEKNLHPFTFQPVISKEEAGHRSCLYQMLFACRSESNETKAPPLMIWFRDKLGYWISKTEVGTAILFLFMLYLAGASYGFTQLKSYYDAKLTYFPDSEAYRWIEDTNRYFTEYTYRVQVAFNATLDYSDQRVQRKILKSIARFHRNKYIQNIESNWLKHYLLLSRYNKTYSSSYNLSDPKEFVDCLRNEFLHHPLGKAYRNDIQFHEDGKHITASRFVLLSSIDFNTPHKEFVSQMRSISDSLPFPVTVQSVWWAIYEFTFIVEPLTLQTVGTIVVTIFLVFILLSGDLLCSIVVTLTTLSIEFGTVGYMSLLGIPLDTVSTVVLILAVGFSVDPTIHMSYAYKELEGSHRERIQQALFATGVPILQGSLSTLLSVSPAVLIQHHYATIFVVIICLVVIISLLHALILLPTFLLFWDTVMRLFSNKSKVIENHSSSSPQLTNVVSNVHISHM